MKAAQKGKLMRMAGNIAAGFAPSINIYEIVENAALNASYAKASISMAKEIIKQIEDSEDESDDEQNDYEDLPGWDNGEFYK